MSDQRRTKRVGIALRMRLRFRKLDEFISQFAVNISEDGMFISSRSPKPVGTKIRFELRLADESPVICGAGVVKWCRPHADDRPRQHHGMGIEFTELTDESRKILRQIVEHRKSVGLTSDSIPFTTESSDPPRGLRDFDQADIADIDAVTPEELHSATKLAYEIAGKIGDASQELTALRHNRRLVVAPTVADALSGISRIPKATSQATAIRHPAPKRNGRKTE